MGHHDRTILSLALPALGALAADPLVSLADTAFVGRLGPQALAALGINTSVFSFAFVVFNFLSYGTTPRIAQALGRNDRRAAGRTVVAALVLAGLLGTAGTVVLFTLSQPVAVLMGADGELLHPTLTYMRIRAFAAPAILVVLAGHGAFRGYGDTQTPLAVTLGLNLINVVLDPVLIFGLGWGVAGAAWATVVAQWTGAAWFLGLLLGTRATALGIPRAWPPLSGLLSLIKVGGVLSIRTFAIVGTLTFATAVATRMGTAIVAAHHVASQLWSLTALLIDGLAIAGQILVARYLGAQDPASARAVSNRLLGWGVSLGCGLMVALVGLRSRLPRLFTDDPSVVAAVDEVWLLVALLQPVNGAVFVWDGIFLGAERYGFTAVTMLVAALVGLSALTATLILDLGLAGVWVSLSLMIGVRALLLAGAYLNPRARTF